MLTSPLLKRAWYRPIRATPSASSVTASRLFPSSWFPRPQVGHHSLFSFRTQPLFAAFAFAISFHTVIFSSTRPYILFPHTATLSSVHLSQSPVTRLPVAALAFSQSFGTRLSSHTVAFAGVRLFHSLSHTALASFAAFRTRSLLVAIAFRSLLVRGCLWQLLSHGRFCRRSPLSQSFAHGRLRQHSPFRSPLAYGSIRPTRLLLAAFTLLAHGRFCASRGSFRLSAVFPAFTSAVFSQSAALRQLSSLHIASCCQLTPFRNLLKQGSLWQPLPGRYSHTPLLRVFHSSFAISLQTVSFPPHMVPSAFAFSQPSLAFAFAVHTRPPFGSLRFRRSYHTWLFVAASTFS